MSTSTTFPQLALVANVRFPSERAHVLQIMQMASSFSAIFERVRLIYPIRANTEQMKGVDDVFEHYGVRRSFGLVGLPCIDAIKRVTMDWVWLASGPLPRIAHLIQTLTFTISAFMFVAQMPACVVYSRDLLVLTLLNLLSTGRGRLFVFEVHTLPRSRLGQQLHLWAVRRADALVTISDHLRHWHLSMGINPKKVITARDGVDLEAYSQLPEKSAARNRLGLHSMASLAVYTGHFFPWKGVHTLVGAACYLPESWRITIVGGIEPDLGRIRKLAANDPRIKVVGLCRCPVFGSS